MEVRLLRPAPTARLARLRRVRAQPLARSGDERRSGVEAIVVLSLLLALDLVAARWGRDSRAGPRTKEQDLAGYGVSWRDLR